MYIYEIIFIGFMYKYINNILYIVMEIIFIGFMYKYINNILYMVMKIIFIDFMYKYINNILYIVIKIIFISLICEHINNIKCVYRYIFINNRINYFNILLNIILIINLHRLNNYLFLNILFFFCQTLFLI